MIDWDETHVKARAQIIRQLLLRPHGMHALGKLGRLRVIRQLALHPDHVRVGCVGDRAVHRRRAAALEAVVALSRPWRVPVPVDVDARQALGDGARLGVRLAFHRGLVLGDQATLVDVHARVDRRDDGIVEEHQIRALQPRALDLLELCAVLALRFRRDHQVVERL